MDEPGPLAAAAPAPRFFGSLKRGTVRYLLTLAVLAICYFVAAKVGLSFAFLNASATAIWPPTGIALAALLVLGVDVWPAILIAAFFANLTTQGSIWTSLCIASGNTLEGIVGALLVSRFARGRWFFERSRGVALFALLAAGLSTTISATIGVTSLALDGLADWTQYGHIWLTWWLGDAAGDLVVAPVLVLWGTRPRIRWRRAVAFEPIAAVGGLVAVALIVFDGLIPGGMFSRLPDTFLCVPFLFWAAFRLGRRATATCMLGLSLIALHGTLRGLGPFGHLSLNEALLMVQAYLAVKSVTMLAAAAVVWEHRSSEARARMQAVSDGLTGLANYRCLMDVLATEIHRTRRMPHPFAVLLVDLDGLKAINDRLGHLAGNRALRRVADVLRDCCRVTDTAARFGGDEFAVILPETSEEGARHLAGRIAARLAADAATPPLTVSIGVAVHPRDGASAERLLSAADRELYRMKAAARDKLAHSPAGPQPERR